MAILRQLVVPTVVTEYLEEEIVRYPRLQQILEGLYWRIQREPEVGVLFPGHHNPPLYLIKSLYRFPLPCAIILLYSYSADEVVIHCARVDESPN